MSTKIWVHKFNNNELGISEEGTGRGSFILVPIDAREILPKLSEENAFKTELKIYLNKKYIGKNNYSKPPSKTEYRLSLSGLSNEIKTQNLLHEGLVTVIHSFTDGINISTNLSSEYLLPFLEEFSTRKPPNNAVIDAVHTKVLPSNSKTTLSKPFLLLAGISGTGKSRFVREQSTRETFELVSVRPDWHEPSDLLGYVLRLSDKPKLITTPVLKFMVKAWLAALKNGVRFDAVGSENDHGISVDVNFENLPDAYWLCLDEMNLAPVEQYFADYLSVIETRKWDGNKYTCHPLVTADFFTEQDLDEQRVKDSLGLGSDEFSQQLWDVLSQHGLPIPFNLMVAGTVNMDETTHGFSRKVIDRSLSLDFGEFFPNEFDAFFEPTSQFKALSYPILSQATLENVGDHAIVTQNFLAAVNAVLKGTLFELAYRALNECLLAVACVQPQNPATLQAVWDDFVMMKVLPRIEGDVDKLKSRQNAEKTILDELHDVLSEQLPVIWEGERPDLLSENTDGTIKLVKCRSRKKIERMSQLLDNGFTHFWP